MNTHLLSDLAHLFSIEAFETDRNGDADEAERLWGIADELHMRCETTTHLDAVEAAINA